MFRGLPPLLATIAILLSCGTALPASAASNPRQSDNPAGTYSLILVDTDSPAGLANARDYIVSQGGSVAVVLPPHSILGWLTPSVASQVRGRAGIRSVHQTQVDTLRTGFTDPETRIAAQLFNEMVSGRAAGRDRRQTQRGTGPQAGRPPMPGCSQPRPPINRDEFLRNLRLLGVEPSTSGVQSVMSPQFFGNTDTMDGNVAVAVFLMESNGGIDPNVYSWTQEDQTIAISRVIEGLNWWVEQSRAFGLARPLQFTVVPFLANNPLCQQPYEPVLHPGFDANLWLDKIMINAGLSQGDIFARIASFNQKVRNENHANWAYSIFIGYNPPPAAPTFTDGLASWAYIGGPHTNVLFRSFGWPLQRIIAHETGHIFYACDEYSQPSYASCSCSCAPELRLNATNGNCQEGCGPNSVECMMRINELSLCPFTAAQIGWTAAVPKPPPTTPLNLVATAASPTDVTLIWQDTSTSEVGFQVERRGGSSAEFSQIAVISANSNAYSDVSALPNTAYAYRVRAFNNSGTSDYSNEASVVTPQTASLLSIGTGELPDATVGVAYSRTLVAGGGRPDYLWVIETGALPDGLSLSQSGNISGVPTTVGTSNMVVKVADTGGNTATRALSISVKPQAPLTITSTQLPRGSVGSTYSQGVGASGGQTPYTWSLSAGSLPNGLSISQAGVISGTPERPGTTSFGVKVTDFSGSFSTATLSISINPTALGLSIDTESLSDAITGQEYSHRLNASGGSAPYVWQLTAGRLPDGLTLSESGLISGTPSTTGELEFTLQVRDQSGLTTSKSLSIDVDPPPDFTIITASALPVASVGVAYRVDFSATGGTDPYKWTKKNKKKFGTLPEGLTVARNGTLSGTPTVQNVYQFTVIATDATGKKATKPFTLEVGPPAPPLAIRTETLPSALQGLPYTAGLEAAGGVAPYTWTLDGGSLPNGLEMNSAGLITGRATVPGAAVFTARLRDATGTTTTRALLINVQPPPPPVVVTTVLLPESTAGRRYTQTLQASGGLPPYTWSLASGSLGPGLNLSASGLIDGTPPAAGTSVFVVRVTDSAQQTATRTLAIKIQPADGLAPFGDLETPAFRTTLANVARGTGWAVDNVGVVAVEVLIDGQKAANAQYGLSRPDLAVIWGAFPNAASSGFAFDLDTSRFPNGDHTLSIRVLDASGNATVFGTRVVHFQNKVLSILTGELSRGRKGQSFSAQLLAAEGKPPYVWSLAQGSLPAGLSLSASGLISGTPTVFGTFTFTVRVTDSLNATAIRSLTLTINPDIEPLRVLTAGPITPGEVGAAYSHQFLFVGGVAPRTWSTTPATGSLPPGLTIGAQSGIISGTPTSAGTFTFTVRITDATSTSAVSQSISITVLPAP